MIKADVSLNLGGLEELQKQMSAYRARVGVLGDKVGRTDGESDLTNSEIGIIQIFGSITDHIPPRDFLLMPLLMNTRGILAAMSSNMVKRAMEAADYKKVFKILGAVGETFVQKAFETSGFGQWAPNSPRTIAAKGSSKPLIDTAQLRRGISSDVVKQGQGGIS